MIEVGAVASENTNLTLGSLSSTGAVDHSYSPYQGKNGGADVATTTMSFDDFMDMVNPLEHIPVISSVYRAIAGENINPVSRIAGDAMYGGILGLASAGISALGAVADEVVAANNDGKSASATVIAALFGDDAPQTTQLAATTVTPPSTDSTPSAQTATLQTPVPEASAPQTPAVTPATATATPAAALLSVADNTSAAPGMALDRSKLPYGGVMDTSMMQNAQQNQALALALANQHNIMQAQHNIRNSRFAANTATPATTATPAADEAQVPVDPQTQAAMQNLIKELQAMKGTNQYKNAAQMTPIPGSALNLAN